MRVEDAPPAGWYPDPEGSTRLRWWEGVDWTDRFRAYPSIDETTAIGVAAQLPPTHAGTSAVATPGWYADPAGGGGQRWWDGTAWTSQLRSAHQLVDHVRDAVREEAERAASQFGAQARYAARDIGPLITEATNKAARLLKRIVILVVVLVVAWFVFQAYANATFFEWIGDRIDRLNDDTAPAGLLFNRPG